MSREIPQLDKGTHGSSPSRYRSPPPLYCSRVRRPAGTFGRRAFRSLLRRRRGFSSRNMGEDSLLQAYTFLPSLPSGFIPSIFYSTWRNLETSKKKKNERRKDGSISDEKTREITFFLLARLRLIYRFRRNVVARQWVGGKRRKARRSLEK